jgi:two-component system, OmpR family, response regulator
LDKVLLVEDDPRIARFVKRGLEAEGYVVDHAADGEDGLELARAGDHAVVILDRMLPRLDGMELCAALRRERRDCLVLMLTAKDSLQDKIEGLHAGADDYLTKPFAFDELLARLAALLRRARRGSGADEDEAPLQVGDLVLDPATRRARRGGREIALTQKEYRLLAYLMQNAGKVVSRTRILNHVWDYSFDPGSKVVDVYVRYLRQKIDDGEERPLLRTVRGFGYTISND